MLQHRPGIIIEEYLLGEKEKVKEGESEGQEVGKESLRLSNDHPAHTPTTKQSITTKLLVLTKTTKINPMMHKRLIPVTKTAARTFSSVQIKAKTTPVVSFQILSVAVACHLSKQASIQTIIQIMNVLRVFVLFAILLKYVVASGDTLGVWLRRAVYGGNFEWLREDWWIWEARNDLIDDVIANGADFTVKLIRCFDHAKRGVLAALFDKGEKMIDDVLGRIEYDDDDLMHLTRYRKELAGSPEKFFRVLDKIKGWGKQRGLPVGVSLT